MAAASASAEVRIEMVTVGDPGNAPNAEGFGAVPYTYRIGVVEVTIGQYTEFLNAVAAKDSYGLYNTMMATTANVAGIERSGSSGSHRYSVIGSALRPITYGMPPVSATGCTMAKALKAPSRAPIRWPGPSRAFRPKPARTRSLQSRPKRNGLRRLITRREA